MSICAISIIMSQPFLHTLDNTTVLGWRYQEITDVDLGGPQSIPGFIVPTCDRAEGGAAPRGHLNRWLPRWVWITKHLLPPYLHPCSYSELSGEVFPVEKKHRTFILCTIRRAAPVACSFFKGYRANATAPWSEPATALVASTTRLERTHVQVEILNMDSVWVQLQPPTPPPPHPISDPESVSPCVNRCEYFFCHAKEMTGG